ncbi:hypothetical protein ACFU99_16685 [Streptomyces sp. NPDC057654]
MTKKCPQCNTNNDIAADLCMACEQKLPRSRVRGTRISRVRRGRGFKG